MQIKFAFALGLFVSLYIIVLHLPQLTLKINVYVFFSKKFREFALKGNVMDMAVGVIIGGAFGKIVSSLVNDILMPPIGALIGNTDFSSLRLDISKVRDLSSKATHVVTDAIGVGYGGECSCGTDLVELRRISSNSAWISLSWPSASF